MGNSRGRPSRTKVMRWVSLVSRSRPFPFITWRRERVWPTAIELPVLAFTKGRVSVNWFEVSKQPMSKRPGCRADNESHYKPPFKATLAASLPQTNNTHPTMGEGSLMYPDPYKKGLGNKARSSVHIGMC